MTNALKIIGAPALLALTLGGAPPAAAQSEPPPLEIGAVAADAALGVSLGMTLAQARAAQPDLKWYFEPTFIVDFSALCAERDRRELFCALVPETDQETPTDRIAAIAVTGPTLATDKGVHAGMLVKAAEEAYGPARLSYNLENEGREYLSLRNAPEGMAFVADSATRGHHVGLYPPPSDDAAAQETDRYAPDAVIRVIWIH